MVGESWCRPRKSLVSIAFSISYCQAMRVYGWHNYGWLYGLSSTIPGY